MHCITFVGTIHILLVVELELTEADAREFELCKAAHSLLWAMRRSSKYEMSAIVKPILQLRCVYIRPHRLAVRTSDSHSDKAGSSPTGVRDGFFDTGL